MALLMAYFDFVGQTYRGPQFFSHVYENTDPINIWAAPPGSTLCRIASQLGIEGRIPFSKSRRICCRPFEEAAKLKRQSMKLSMSKKPTILVELETARSSRR